MKRCILAGLIGMAMLSASRVSALDVGGYDDVTNNRFVPAGSYTNVITNPAYTPVPNTNSAFIGYGYDFSGVGWSTNYGSGDARTIYAITLITPRNSLEATHTTGSSSITKDFLGQNGQLATVARSMFSNVVSGNDISIGFLDTYMPASNFAIYPLMDLGLAPANYVGSPLMMYGWYSRVGTNYVSSANAVNFSYSSTYWVGPELSLATNTPQSWAFVRSGDSCSPDFIPYVDPITGAKGLSVLGTHWGYGTDPFTPAYWTNLNAVINPTGYALKWVGPVSQVWTNGGGDGLFTNTANWSSSVPGSTNNILFDVATAGGQNVINLGGTQSLNGLYFKNAGGVGFTLTNGQLALGRVGLVNGSNGTLTVQSGVALTAPQIWDGGNGGMVINGNVTNNGNLWVMEGTGTNRINGSVYGAGGLAKDGTGLLILNGTNQFGGPLFVHNGTVDLSGRLTTVGALGGEGGELVNQGGLKILGSNTSRVEQESGMISGTGRVWKLGNGVEVLSGSNTFSGGLEIQGGAVVYNGDLALGSTPGTPVSGNIWLNGGTLLAGSNNATSVYNANRGIWLGATNGFGAGGLGADRGATLVVTGGVADAAGGVGMLVAGGGGVLQLGGSNTYSGGTMVTNGALVVLSDSGLGALPGTPSASNLVLNGGSLLVVSNGTYINPNRGIALGSLNGSGSGVFDVTQGVTFAYGGDIGNYGGVGSTGLLMKAGLGTLVLSGTNTFGGLMNIGGSVASSVSNGTLMLAGAQSVISSYLSVGVSTNQTGTLVVSGGNLYSTNSDGAIYCGQSGYGRMIVSNGNVRARSMVVGMNGSGNGDYVMAGGSNSWIGNFYAGLSGGSGVVTVTGGALVGDSGSALIVGETGNGLVTVSNGMLQAGRGYVGLSAGSTDHLQIFGGTNNYILSNNAGALIVGSSTGSTGLVLVAGAGVLTTSAGGMTIGSAGRGLMTVSNGGLVNSPIHMVIGGAAGGSGELDVNGGAVVVGDNLQVGGASGATGSVVVTSGSLSVVNPSYTLSVGNVSGGVGNLTVGGGLLTAYTLNVGAIGGSWGTMSITGGVVTVTNALTVGAVSGATGSLAVAGGSLRLTGGSGYLEARYGSIDLTGGSTLASSVIATNSGRVLIGNGALLEANSLIAGGSGGAITNNGGIFQFTTTAPGVTTNTPGSVVMANGVISYRNVGAANIASPNVSHMTFQGNNAFRLNNSTNASVASYTFDTNSGSYQSLQLMGAAPAWQGTALTVGAGGSLMVTNTASAYVSGLLTNAGTISVMNGSVVYGGDVVNQGAYVSDPSTNTFNGTFTVAPAATVTAAAGDIYAFGSNFVMQSTNRNFNMSVAVAYFGNTNYGITTGAINHTFDLTGSGSVDMGSNGFMSAAQLATNFSIGTLSIALSNNLTVMGTKTGSLTNALYVGWLDLSAWNTNAASLNGTLQAALNLININFYYDMGDARNAYLQSASYAFWGGGGMLVPIPEPSVLTLALAAGALSAFILRRKR